MRAAGYIHVRTDAGSGLPAAQKAISGYCLRNKHDLLETFHDEGGETSGYQELLKYLKASGGKVIVVIPDATHLGNDLESFARSLLEIESMGLKVYSADHDYPDPIQSALHSIGVRGVSRTRSERIKTSMRARALRGQGLGRPLYGYEISDDGSMKVVKQEAAVVELVFKLYVQDKLGFRLIAQHLNERNIRTRRGGDWNVVSIRDMIRNPGYMGTYSRFGLMVPRGYPAIVPALTFRAAQDLMSERRPFGRVSNPEPFLLSGMAYCGTCGNKMMGVTRRQTWKKKDGRRNHGVYRYYQCQSRQNQSRCGYHTWRAPRLEAAVLSQLRLALQAKEGQAAGDAGASDNGRGAALKEARGKRVVNAERRFVDAMKRAAKAEIGIAIVGEYLGELDKARRAVQGTGGGQNPAQRLNQWDSLNLTQRRDLLAENISRIVVHDETVEVVV